MTTEKKKMIALYKSLGATLSKKGHWFLQRAFHLKPKVISKTYLKQILAGLNFENIYLPDKNYYLIDWETMKQIIEYDWLDRKKYVKDSFDCDNYSDVFSAHIMEIYELNSVGTATKIELVRADTEKHIGWHRANLIITLGNGYNVYLYEPMNDKFCKIERNEEPVIGNWKYLIKKSLLEFN